MKYNPKRQSPDMHIHISIIGKRAPIKEILNNCILLKSGALSDYIST